MTICTYLINQQKEGAFIFDKDSYPPEGSGNILGVYECGHCVAVIEPTTEKVADVTIRSFDGKKVKPGSEFAERHSIVICSQCCEEFFAPALDRPGGKATLDTTSGPKRKVVFTVHKCYNLYNVDSFKKNI